MVFQKLFGRCWVVANCCKLFQIVLLRFRLFWDFHIQSELVLDCYMVVLG